MTTTPKMIIAIVKIAPFEVLAYSWLKRIHSKVGSRKRRICALARSQGTLRRVSDRFGIQDEFHRTVSPLERGDECPGPRGGVL